MIIVEDVNELSEKARQEISKIIRGERNCLTCALFDLPSPILIPGNKNITKGCKQIASEEGLEEWGDEQWQNWCCMAYTKFLPYNIRRGSGKAVYELSKAEEAQHFNDKG